MALDFDHWYPGDVSFFAGRSFESFSMIERPPTLKFTHPLPYGAICHDDGVQFVVVSRSATGDAGVDLRSRPRPRARRKSSISTGSLNRWGDIWSVFVPGMGPGQLYHFQADGPFEPERRPAIRSQRPADRPLRQGPGRHVPAGRRRDRPPAQVRGDRRRVRLAGRPPPAARSVRDDHLRDARPRVHAVADQRRGASGHVPRADREDSVPADRWA